MHKQAVLFLHALPFDGTMWRFQRGLFEGPSYAPSLYEAGDKLQNWAARALALINEEKLVIVGNSIGGSCALEIAAQAPDRVAALVLCGTKANRNPAPAFLETALAIIENEGPNAAWNTYWRPLFSPQCDSGTIDLAAQIFAKQSTANLVDGTRAFHTRSSRGDVLKNHNRATVFVSGADDCAPGPEISHQQAKDAIRGTCHIIPNCGHYAPLEAPERFNQILLQVLSPYLR